MNRYVTGYPYGYYPWYSGVYVPYVPMPCYSPYSVDVLQKRPREEEGVTPGPPGKKVYHGPIILEGADGSSVTFPAYLIELSPMIRTLIQNPITFEVEKNTLRSERFNATILNQLKELLTAATKAARDDQGRVVLPENIDENTIFVHELMQRQLPNWVPTLDNAGLRSLYDTVDFLQIQPLKEWLDNLIAVRILRERPQLNIDNIGAQLRANPIPGLGDFNGEQLRYIREYIYLIQRRLTKRSIADWIGLHGQPPREDGLISFWQQGFTSLQGLDRILNPESVWMLSFDGFGRDHILGSDMDPYFPRKPFEKWRNLQRLDLSTNQLRYLPDDLFYGLSNLERLSLAVSRIRHLPEGIFQGLEELQQLSLNQNQLTALPSGLFKGLGELTSLNLESNQLKSLPEGIFNDLSRLQSLYLQSNQLEDLPKDTFHNLKQLRELNMSQNRFSQDEAEFRTRYNLPREVALTYWAQLPQA